MPSLISGHFFPVDAVHLRHSSAFSPSLPPPLLSCFLKRPLGFIFFFHFPKISAFPSLCFLDSVSPRILFPPPPPSSLSFLFFPLHRRRCFLSLKGLWHKWAINYALPQSIINRPSRSRRLVSSPGPLHVCLPVSVRRSLV